MPSQVYRPIAAALARLLAAFGLGVAPVFWLMAMPGWPLNHEILRLFRRMGILAGQWSLGHWLPVWSTSACGGLGSPSPIIYHKVFSLLSTSLYVLTGAPKSAVCLSIVLVLAVACLGIFRATRIILGGPNLAIEAAAGLLLALCTYTTTDWLTRGALAELCALAGVAWLFAWCLTLIRQGRFSLWIAPLMAAIVLSHAAIGLFCALPLGVAVLVAAPRWRAAWPGWCRAASISVLCTVGMLAPVLIASQPYAGWSSLPMLALGMARGNNDFALSRLLWEPVWHWDGLFDLTLQIDPLLLACGAGALVLACARRVLRAETIFLLASTAIAVALESRAARPLFQAVPILYWLQFAFRLQIFAVVGLALCGVVVLQALQSRLGKIGMALALLPIAAAMSVGKPWLGHHPDRLYFTDAQLRAALGSETDAPEAFEYRPRLGGTPSGAVCLGRALDDLRQERATARFAIACGGAGAVLPVYLVPGMKLQVNGAAVTPSRSCDDARLHIPAPADGIAEIVYPTWTSAVAAALGMAPKYSCQ